MKTLAACTGLVAAVVHGAPSVEATEAPVPEARERMIEVIEDHAQDAGPVVGRGVIAPQVLDAMAGWGADGMILAVLGSPVVMVEHNDVMWALLDSFLATRSERRPELIHADAWTILDGKRTFDVVYLDPMFPRRRKGALPGKSMQLLTRVCGPDERSAADWVERARPCAAARVVLKRRLRDPLVGRPDWQIKGRAVRYDVYRGVSSPGAQRSGTRD